MDREIAKEIFAACERAIASLTELEHAICRVSDDDERKTLIRALGDVIGELLGEIRAPTVRLYPELERPEVLGQPDTVLSPDEQASVSKLTPPEIELIDRALLSDCAASWRKVASVVGTSMLALKDQVPNVPDGYYAQRVALLVAAGKLESQGNLEYMRFSEVRLARNHSSAA